MQLVSVWGLVYIDLLTCSAGKFEPEGIKDNNMYVYVYVYIYIIISFFIYILQSF